MFQVLFIESLQCLGVFLLLNIVLPNFDTYRSLFLLTAVATIPAFLQMFSRPQNKPIWHTVLDIFAFLMQLSALIFWLTLYLVEETENEVTIDEFCDEKSWNSSKTLSENTTKNNTTNYLETSQGLPDSFVSLVVLPVALFLCSLAWWENYIDMHSRLGRPGVAILAFRDSVKAAKTKIYAVVAMVKILVTFSALLLVFGLESDNTTDIKGLFSSKNFFTNRCDDTDDVSGEFVSDWLVVTTIQVVVGAAAFYLSDLAVKGHMQMACFTLPLFMSTPIVFGLLTWACESCDTSFVINIDYTYFFNCYHGFDSFPDSFLSNFIYFGAVWWLSQVWISRHVWSPTIERLAKSDK